MGESEFAPGSCQEMAGFLFSHACGDIAVRDCADCGKPICQRHSIDLGGLLKCVACAKAERANPNKNDDPNSSDTSRRRRDDDFDDGPYFYSDSYYHSMGGRPRHFYRSSHHEAHSASDGTEYSGSGPDDNDKEEPDDFNDSDEAALMEGEPSADDVREFEGDMGAS